MSLSGAEYLRHILDEVDYLTEHSRGVTHDQFLQDETLRRAFVRSLEIIGEAAKKVLLELAKRIRDIEWRAIEELFLMVTASFGIRSTRSSTAPVLWRAS
ncbi:MAG: DUF86 domain-containing protein [Acidobacteria bacterium]|nr:DUF86 domain-containing protein [Acidobacteriota bacterium]